MSVSKTYTLDDVRAAYVHGAKSEHEIVITGAQLAAAEQRAATVYPDPGRPRVVQDGDLEFMVDPSGELIGRDKGRGSGTWAHINAFNVSTRRVRLWADLLANPTEPLPSETAE